MFNNKGVSSYIIVLFVFSIFMTILLYLLLGTIYQEDNQLCQSVDFQLKNTCKKSGFLSFTVANKGGLPFAFEIEGIVRESKSGEDTKVKIYTQQKTIDFTPQVSDGFNKYTCNSKTETIKMELVPIC